MQPNTQICGAIGKTRQFTGYAFGDPLPVYAQFAKEGDEEIALYVTCQREAGHGGYHLAKGTAGWLDEDERIRDHGDY